MSLFALAGGFLVGFLIVSAYYVGRIRGYKAGADMAGDTWEAVAYYSLGLFCQKAGMIDEAKENFEHAYEMYERQNNELWMGRAATRLVELGVE